MERMFTKLIWEEFKMNQIETKVGMEIEERLDEMAQLKTTEEAYKATSDVTLKLIDRMTEMEKIELQAEANRLKHKELEEAKKRRIADTIVQGAKTVGSIVVPVVMAIGLTVYEQTDSTTSTATKEFWKKIFRLT